MGTNYKDVILEISLNDLTLLGHLTMHSLMFCYDNVQP